MKCRCCNNEINKVLISKFDREGSDYLTQVDISEEHTQADYKAIAFMTTTDWTGYGLDSEDNIKDVICPICKQPLFYEVDYYEMVYVVGFCENGKENEE